MTSRRKKYTAIWDDILKLANNDDALVRAAVLRATGARGHVCLKDVKNYILNTTNPALLATIDAAENFIRTVDCDDRAIDLPHLHRVYALAESDPRSASRVFNDAATFVKRGTDVESAIDVALLRYTENLHFH